RRFADDVVAAGSDVTNVRVQLFGSLGATGVGHGTVAAVVLGLTGVEPERVDPDAVDGAVDEVRVTGRLRLAGELDINFSVEHDIVLTPDELLPGHPNGMRFTASGAEQLVAEYFSVGGGFVATADELD